MIIQNGNIENIQLSEYKLNEGVITGLVLYPSLHQLYVQTDSKVVQVTFLSFISLLSLTHEPIQSKYMSITFTVFPTEWLY